MTTPFGPRTRVAVMPPPAERSASLRRRTTSSSAVVNGVPLSSRKEKSPALDIASPYALARQVPSGEPIPSASDPSAVRNDPPAMWSTIACEGKDKGTRLIVPPRGALARAIGAKPRATSIRESPASGRSVRRAKPSCARASGMPS